MPKIPSFAPHRPVKYKNTTSSNKQLPRNQPINHSDHHSQNYPTAPKNVVKTHPYLMRLGSLVHDSQLKLTDKQQLLLLFNNVPWHVTKHVSSRVAGSHTRSSIGLLLHLRGRRWLGGFGGLSSRSKLLAVLSGWFAKIACCLLIVGEYGVVTIAEAVAGGTKKRI